MGLDGPIDVSLGAQVRQARLATGTSLRGLARQLGVSPATLSQIETGRTGLSVQRLGRIAEALGLTVPQILDVVVAPPGAPPAAAGPAGSGQAGSGQAGDGTPAEPPRAAARVRWREYGPLDFDPVLRAALDEILAIGYHAATVRGIAARAGLSVSGIYHYYTSKQHMLVTILDLTMADLLARSRAAHEEGHDPVERFCLLVEALVLFHTHRRELGFVGAAEMRSLEPVNRARIAELRTVQQRMVDHEVAEAVRLGRFRADHPHGAARAVVTMCTALPTWWRPDGPLSPEQVAAQYVGFARQMMGA